MIRRRGTFTQYQVPFWTSFQKGKEMMGLVQKGTGYRVVPKKVKKKLGEVMIRRRGTS